MGSPILLCVNRIRRFYAQNFQQLAAKYGLSQLEIDILLFLHNNPRRNTARDIVELRGFAKSNVSTALESLRRRGILSVQADPDSRKVRRLHLSPAYRARYEELAACQQACLSAALAGFSPEERELLRQLLQRVDDNIAAALAAEKEN